MIDRETVQRIKDTANIVEVVGDYVNLIRRGANYMGLCPFHNERTPSFSVSPKRNYCRCFSCGKGGTPIGFLMEKEGISYHDALLWLAKKYNITVQEKELTDEERKKITERESMLVASEWAMRHFHDNLFNTDEGRNIGLSYFYSRGLTDESIKKYMLGYSMDNSTHLLTKARNEGFDLEVLVKIGLLGKSEERMYDKFRGRVMFPIRNTTGKPVAFGGRTLKGDKAKYINSPETLLYKKSNELYGIFEAKNEIVKKERVFLMEGYLDVISSYQSGIKNILASSGTALTDSQIALLHRFTDNVTLVYDGDAAGIKASLRGIDMLLSHKLHVNVLLLPEGHDPDSFAKSHNSEEFQKYFETHQTDFIEFKSQVLMKDAEDNPQERAKAIMSVIESIACIPNEVERSLYIQKCSSLMNVDEAAIAQSVRRLRKQKVAEQFKNKNHIVGHNNKSNDVEEKNASEKEKKSETEFASSKSKTLMAIEKELIKYCVRYGFAPVESHKDISFTGDEEPILVIEYVADEFEADELKFSHGPYQKTFETILKELPEFLNKRKIFISEEKARQAEDREKFIIRLINKGTSVAEIEKAEQRFESELSEKENEAIRIFSLHYSGPFLMDHEDDEVRSVANLLLPEPHQLSSIYTRDGRKVLLEEDKLYDLLPRAMAELRGEIVDMRVKEIKKRISAISNTGEGIETLEETMKELQKLLKIRAKFAENLGERILPPR